MSLLFFEDLFDEQIAKKLPEIKINERLSNKPAFGWGNVDDLNKFLGSKERYQNPLIWSVPRDTVPSTVDGLYERVVELNLCVMEGDTELLNEVRMQPSRSFKGVLSPLWEKIERGFALSDMTVVNEVPTFQLIPNYQIGDSHGTQYVWDILKVLFEINYPIELSYQGSCNCK